MLSADGLSIIQKTGELKKLRKTEIIKRIRLRYDADDAEAIMRQRDRKPEEFEEFDRYCEECKAQVDEMLANL